MFDTSKPDGMPRKLLDVSRLHALGWRHRIDLREGIAATYQWFLDHQDRLRTARTPNPSSLILESRIANPES
jgi:GDP-L-fucose synthase